MSLATISIVGNMVKPPEQTYFASGRVKTTLVVAINNPSSRPSSEKANFYRVETWGKLAELAGKYLSKGNQVGASGRLTFDHWVDKSGKDRFTPIIEATQVSFPPKLKVVSDDESTAGLETEESPISGELQFAVDSEVTEATSDTTCGDALTVKEDLPPKNLRRRAQTA